MNFKDWLELHENHDYFGAFQRWYDSNRGSWKQVELAAQKDPKIRYLINTAMGHLDSFSGPMYGKLADAIGKQVSIAFPKHVTPNDTYMNTQQARAYQVRQGEVPQQSSDPQATKNPSSANGNDGFSMGARMSNTSPEITRAFTDFDKRLRNLEMLLQRNQAGHTSNNASTAALPSVA